MKTYYIHGKITPTGFHLAVTLLKKSPRGYYCICEQIADSKHQAVRLTVEQCSLHSPKGKEIMLGITPGLQTSFIRES